MSSEAEEIDEKTTVADLLERYKFLKDGHPKLFARPTKTERRKARKQK